MALLGFYAVLTYVGKEWINFILGVYCESLRMPLWCLVHPDLNAVRDAGCGPTCRAGKKDLGIPNEFGRGLVLQDPILIS